MKLPRLTIGRMMGCVAILGLPLALLQNELSGHNLTCHYSGTDLGLWPPLTAFGIASFSIIRNRGKCSPLLWGFAAVGWASVLAYLALCAWFPQIVAIPIVYYCNEIDTGWIVWLIDSDTYEGHGLSLMTLGLILATPQLMMATLGGLIARWIWGTRWNTT